MTIIGVAWTTNASSPTLTRIGQVGDAGSYTGPASAGALFDAWAGGPWKGMQRCNVWDDGSLTSVHGTRCYTDTDVGTLGQSMVQIPAFLYFVDPSSTANTIKFYIGLPSDIGSWIQTSGGWYGYYQLSAADMHPLFVVDGTNVADAYVSTYEGYFNTTTAMIESKAGVAPSTFGTNTLAREYAENRGTGWELMTIQALSALQLLYIVEYASLNSQASVGNGFTGTTLQNTGATGSTGTDRGNLTYGVTANATTAMSYRGVENLFGNMQTQIEGLNVDASQYAWVAPQSRTRPSYYTWAYVAPYVKYSTILNGGAGSFMKTHCATPAYTFLPLAGAGNATTYCCDEIFEAAAGDNVLLSGGQYDDTTAAGIFAQRYTVVDTVASGARIQYLPSV